MPAPPAEAARDLHARGLAAMELGRPLDSARLLRRALATLNRNGTTGADHGTLRARVLITLAHAEFELVGLGPAEARLDAAADLVGGLDAADLDVRLHNQRGLLLVRAGRFAEALQVFDAATPKLEQAPRVETCRILLNRSVANLELHRVADARADLTECVRIAEQEGLTQLQVKALHNLGYVEFVAGEMPEALRLMDEASSIDSTVAPGVAHLGKAQVLVEAGLLRAADQALATAAHVLRRDRAAHDLAEAQLERARCALALGDVASAMRLADIAARSFRRRGSQQARRAAELVALQGRLAARRQLGRLVPRALSLRADLAAEGLRLHARAATLIAAEALAESGRAGAAGELLAEIGPPRRDDPITGRMQFHYVHARVDAASGRPGAASRRIRRALDELARYQASFGSIDLRTASAVHGRRLAELDITLALESGRAADLFTAAERARAVSARLPVVRPPDDPVAADLLAELRQTIEAWRAVEQERAASAPLLRRRRELERQIAARSWTVTGSRESTRPAPLDAVRTALAERDRSMVMYVQAADVLTAVVVGRRLRTHALGSAAPVVEWVRRARADLDVLAQPRLPGPLRAAVRASLDRALTELDAALVAPLGVDDRLVVVSTGLLGQLPWGSLPSLRGRAVTVAPSATKWLTSTPASGARARVAAIAGPDLLRGRSEAEVVGRTWSGADVLTGRDAGAAALAQLMGTVDLLHVAAHGVHQPENPLFSSLRLADGPVFAHELDRHGRAPAHVVLSACEVGLATIRPGDEALGLASVLLQLGTRSVIASVARVGDEVAEQTMAVYHAKLAAGADSSVALAEALAEVDTDVVPPLVNFGAAWTPSA